MYQSFIEALKETTGKAAYSSSPTSPKLLFSEQEWQLFLHIFMRFNYFYFQPVTQQNSPLLSVLYPTSVSNCTFQVGGI